MRLPVPGAKEPLSRDCNRLQDGIAALQGIVDIALLGDIPPIHIGSVRFGARDERQLIDPPIQIHLTLETPPRLQGDFHEISRRRDRATVPFSLP
jgi:hypothetical protein